MTAPCPIFGFLVEIEIDDYVSPVESDSLWNAFMAFVQQRGLEADGGRGSHMWTYRLCGESAQASDLDRAALQEWASKHREIVSIRIGDLFDVQSTV
jgi:uncharacterized protein YggL (DUF469 family)